MKPTRWICLALAALAGCSESRANDTTDVPTSTTDTLVVDVGTPVDAGTPIDVGAPLDAGNPIDVVSANDTGTPADIVDAGGPTDAGFAADAGSPVDAGGSTDVPSAATIVINEIRATGTDWIEFKNVGGASFDLSGMILADTDTTVDGGAPRIEDGARFPAGTTLAAGQYLLVVADLNDAGTGPQMTCLDDAGPMTCYQAHFGISASRGERLYLLRGDGSEVISSEYPANAAPDGDTWGRLPDGTGDFAVTAQTPGAANTAP